MAHATKPLKAEVISLWKSGVPVSKIHKQLPVGRTTVFEWVAEERKAIAQAMANSTVEQELAS